MQNEVVELRHAVRSLENQVRGLRMMCLCGVLALVATYAVRPAVSQAASAGGDNDGSGRTVFTTARGPKAKRLRALAPFEVFDSQGRLVAEIGTGFTTGAGYVQTFTADGLDRAFIGNSTLNNGRVSAENGVNSADSRFTTSDTGGSVETRDSAGNVTFGAP